jgi:hypothetical protein
LICPRSARADDATLAATLGFQQGLIGTCKCLYQRFVGGSLSDAGRELQRPGLGRHCCASAGPKDVLDAQQDVFRIHAGRTGQYDRELIAAQARHRVFGPKALTQ